MPSVGMRRTRVCVDGVRILRSGRRLRPDAGDGKFRRANDGDECLHTMLKSSATNTANNKNHHKNNNSSVKCKVNGCTHVYRLRKETPSFDAEVTKGVSKRVESENLNNDTEKKMFGLVYTRKRKRMGVHRREDSERKMFGIQFYRRRRRRRQVGSDSLVGFERAILAVFIEGSCSSGLVSFLNLVFGYIAVCIIRRATLRFSKLAAFLSSEPVSSAFASGGIRFLQGSVVDTEVTKGVSKRVESENLINDTKKKMFGLVYTRKRKRMGVDSREDSERKMFGIHFYRRRRRRRQVDSDSLVVFERAILAVFIEGSCSSGLVCFLNLVFGYIRRATLRFSKLAAFLASEPVSSAFASGGIRFLQDTTACRTGICKFFGPRSTVPLFSLDFSAVPFCFMYMHLNLLVRFKCLPLVPINTSLDEDSCDEESKDYNSSSVLKTDTVPEIDKSGNSMNKVVLHPSIRASKLIGRNSRYRYGLNSHGIQKRRSLLCRRRARNPSLVGMHKANGALVSDQVSNRKNGIPVSSVVSKNKLRSSVQSRTAAKLNFLSSNLVEVARDFDSTSCFANILVIESDRCYRIKGITITLEISDSKLWVLVMMKDGLTRYTHVAQKSMRPCSSNRVTHDIIWTGDENWKLEFRNRQDWDLFKDLYKECSDRNASAPISKAIPVPVVCEVPGYEEINSLPFLRTEAYISISNNEMARALAKKTANYDMDSEDEDWLKMFNNEHQEHLSEDTFELMIDAFEKSFYCNPDNFVDQDVALNQFMELGRKVVVEAVYVYWMKKRKQRRSALLRVFQGHQTKKAQVIPKPILRKRRSFKRQASHFGGGKQRNLLQAMAAENDALKEQDAMHKAEAAKNSMELAILKRSRAQMLMENADLAVYKAAKALRIAEAAHLANSTDVVTHFFD